MNILLISLFPVIILFLRLTDYCHRALSSHPRTSRSALKDICDLLAPPNSTIEALLESRATPNRRLVRAFDIHNTFVSPDTEVHNRFRNQALELMKAATPRDSNYRSHQKAATHAVEHFAPTTAVALALDTYIQSVTLSVVIVTLLGIDVDISSFDSQDIQIVTRGINELWLRSKSLEPITDSLLHKVKTHLRKLVPDEERFPNPLEFVIPAWETLWRVVGIAFIHTYDNKPARASFSDFHQVPCTGNFRKFGVNAPSVESVITETLRLHPPTKHISRAIIPIKPSLFSHVMNWVLRKNTTYSPHIEIADIASVQRSSVWGPTSVDLFDPMRHHPSRLEKAQADTLLAFGYGKLGCIANKWAPVVAGVIVASLLDGLDETRYKIVRGGEIRGRDGWQGWLVKRV